MQFDGLMWCTYYDDNITTSDIITFLDLNNKTWVVATWTIIGFSKVDTHLSQMIESSFYSMIVAKVINANFVLFVTTCNDDPLWEHLGDVTNNTTLWEKITCIAFLGMVCDTFQM